MFNFIFIYCIILNTHVMFSFANVTVLDIGVLPLKKNSAAILLYVNIENKSELNSYNISTRTDRCCLKVSFNDEDCKTMDLIGGDFDVIKPKQKKLLIFVHPTVFQHDKFGSCFLTLLTQTEDVVTEKQQVEIPLDTRIFATRSSFQKKSLFKEYHQLDNAQRCLSQDQDSLNECQPVKCELKYNGLKTHFDQRVHRCVPAPTCLSDESKEHPNIVYVRRGNICRDLNNPVSANDLYMISIGSKTILPRETTTERNDGIQVACGNCKSLSQYCQYIKDLFFRKHCFDSATCLFRDCSKEAKLAATAAVAVVVTACFQLLMCVCALTMLLKFHEMWKEGSLKEKKSIFLYHIRNMKNFICCKKTNKTDEEEGLLLNELLNNDAEDEMRQSISDLCERMSREVSKSKRYRTNDIGSQFSLNEKNQSVSIMMNNSTGSRKVQKTNRKK